MNLASLQDRVLAVPLPRALAMAAVLVLLHRIGLVIYRLYLDPLAKIPGPRLWAASRLPFHYRDKLVGSFNRDMTAVHARYGPVVRIAPDQIAVDGAVGWPDVFLRRPHQDEFAKVWQVYGLGPHAMIGAGRDDHRRQRRALAYAFSAAALATQERYVRRHLDKLVAVLGAHADAGRAADVARWYNNTTFDVIGDLAFGESFGCLDAPDGVHPLITNIFSSFRATSRSVFCATFPLLRPLAALLNLRDLLHKRTMQRFSERRAEARMGRGADDRTDLMTYILKGAGDKGSGKGLSHEEILLTARTLLLAGTETTATALSGFTFHICRNPDVYATLAAEVRAAFAADAEIDIHATAHLPYLNATIEEVLRIFTPVPEIPKRVSPGDVVGGYYIPKGTLVSVNQWATSHSERNFADPEKFTPERWLPKTHPRYDSRYEDDNKGASRPFAAGPRDCLGKNLAYAEMRLVIARLLWNFDFDAVPGQDDWIERQAVFGVVDKGPFNIRLRRRQGETRERLANVA